MVEFHLADDVTQRGLRQFLDGVGQIVDFVNGLKRVDNLEVEQRVDLHLNVIFGDNVLLVEVVHLFAQVDRVGVDVASVGHRDDGFGTVYERDDDVDAGFEGGVIFAEPLNNLCFRLWNDDQCHLRENQH